jgi:hypothetical protein
MKKRYVIGLILGIIGCIYDIIDIYSFVNDFKTFTITGQPPTPDFNSVITWAAIRWVIVALVSGGLLFWGFTNRK